MNRNRTWKILFRKSRIGENHMRKEIYSDYYRRYGTYRLSLKHRLVPFTMPPQIRHFIYIRKWKNTNLNIYKKVLEIKMLLLKAKSQIDIPPSTEIGLGISMYHTGLVVINPNAKIGINVTVSPGITIGKTIVRKNNKSLYPKIGNNVWIGSNSTIVGGIIVGDNVLIAANTFVNCDVPSNSVVFGNPAIIKTKMNATSGYIKNPIENYG